MYTPVKHQELAIHGCTCCSELLGSAADEIYETYKKTRKCCLHCMLATHFCGVASTQAGSSAALRHAQVCWDLQTIWEDSRMLFWLVLLDTWFHQTCGIILHMHIYDKKKQHQGFCELLDSLHRCSANMLKFVNVHHFRHSATSCQHFLSYYPHILEIVFITHNPFFTQTMNIGIYCPGVWCLFRRM